MSQSYIWVGGTGNDHWSDGANWQNGVAPHTGFETELDFLGNTTTVDDLGTGFSLYKETFQAGSAYQSGDTIHTDNGGEFDLSPGAVVDILNPVTIITSPLSSIFEVQAAQAELNLYGAISGSGGMELDGGSVYLATQNSFSGGLSITGAAVSIGDAKSLGKGPVMISSGSLNLAGYTVAMPSLTFGDGVNASSGVVEGGTLALAGDIDIDAAPGAGGSSSDIEANIGLNAGNHNIESVLGKSGQSGALMILSGVMYGPGSLSFVNTANPLFHVALEGQNTFLGGITIGAKTDVFNDVINELPTLSSLTVNGEYDLTPPEAFNGVALGSFNQSLGGLSGAGTVNIGQAVLTVGANNQSTTFSGQILSETLSNFGGNQVLGPSVGTLEKIGDGTLELAAQGNSYGDTFIEAGAIALGADDALGGGNLVIVGGQLALGGYSIGVDNLAFGDGATQVIGNILGGGSIGLGGSIFYWGSPSQSGQVGIDADIVLSGGTHVVSSNSFGSGSGPELNFLGTLSGPGGIEFEGPGLVSALVAANDYSGQTVVDAGSSLILDVKDALPSTTELVANGLVSLTVPASAGYLKAGDFDETVLGISGSGTIALGSADLTVGGGNSNSTFSGSLTGSAGKLTKVGSGSLTLTGNTSLGGFDVESGSLIGSTSSLGGTVTDESIVVFDQDSDGTYRYGLGGLSGEGLLKLDGSGRIDFTYMFDLAHFFGTLQIDAGTLATQAGEVRVSPEIAAGATLELDQSSAGTLVVPFSGTGEFLKTGSGELTLNGQTFGGTTVVSDGALSISGVSWDSLSGIQIGTDGSIVLGGGTSKLLGGTLENSGTLSGSGEIGNDVVNESSGLVSVGSQKVLKFSGRASNAGSVQLNGGSAVFDLGLTNEAGGVVTGVGTLQTGGSGLMNKGSLSFGSGESEVVGPVDNVGAGTISNSGTLVFEGNVDQNGGLIQTSAGARTQFLGNETGAGGFSGTGTVEFDATLHPGNSPDIVSYGGNVVLGAASVTQMLIEGTSPGTGYDQMVVAGTTSLNGTLEVTLGGGFTPLAGQQYLLIDGVTTGSFAVLDLPTLANGLVWASSEGANGFDLSVRPLVTPEPGTWIVLGAGLLPLARRRKR